MCGIIGYCGKKAPIPLLLQGLRSLEYRGYDSAGIAILENGELTCRRASGRISALESALSDLEGAFPDGIRSASIGHTRWATHGRPEERNAHPHSAGRVTLVHNGIIENHDALRVSLAQEGRVFCSDTDTEAAAHLIDKYYSELTPPPNSENASLGLSAREERGALALLLACKRLRGSFALGVLFHDIPERIFAIRRDSPLIISKNPDECFIASDVTALLGKCKSFIRLEPERLAICSPEGLLALTLENEERMTLALASLAEEEIKWNAEQAHKSGFKHFMIKEIYESPEAIKKTVLPRISNGLPSFGLPFIDHKELSGMLLCGGRIHIVACGTAYHAGLVGKHLIEGLARIPVSVEIASEFRYRLPILGEKDCVILLSQSGETADTLASLRYAKEKGVQTLSIVNVYGSTVARESDHTVYTLAGPEIAVASTKAYSVQCACLALLAIRLALDAERIPSSLAREYCSYLAHDLPSAIEKALTLNDDVRSLCHDPSLHRAQHVFYIGRGIDNLLCVEGALKLKEISYIHSEAYAAGELKHGTISLVTDGTPIIALMTDKGLYEKTLSAIREVKSRGAHVIALVSEGIINSEEYRSLPLPADRVIKIPDVIGQDEKPRPEFMRLFPAACILQLLAYHTADALGNDVDMPRNLAKSVTVE